MRVLHSMAFALCTVCLYLAGGAAAANQAPERKSVLAFGAKADGVSDDTPAFAGALAVARHAGGGVVEVPAGTYMLKGTLEVPSGVTLQGVLTAPPSSPIGTILLTTEGKGNEVGTPFITLRDSATIKGLCIVYPEQDKKQPVPYPWCIRSNANNCAVIDLLLLNPWQGIDFGTNTGGRNSIRGLNAQAIRRGIYVDRCFDIGRIENVHLWPFWTVGDKDGPWIPLTQKEGEGFIFARSDWEYVSNSFAIAYHIGIHFVRSHDSDFGAGNYLLTQTGADVSDIATQVDETQDHSGISFNNCQLFGDVVVKPSNNGMVKFTACGFFGSLEGKAGTAQARLDGHGRVSFDNCSFHCIDPRNQGKYLIVANSGRLSIVNCQFVTSEFTSVNPIPIYLGDKVVSAIIVANEFNGKMQIENHSTGQVRIADNTSETEAAYNAVVEKRGQIRLGLISPCTEVADLVANGDFERMEAAGKPLGWSVNGDIAAGNAAVPLPKGWPGKTVVTTNPARLKQIAATMTLPVKLKPNTDYVLSGYMWNMPHGTQTVMANIDVGLETPGYMRLTISPRFGACASGYFVYGRFNTAKTGTNTLVRIFYDGSYGLTDPSVVSAQWDRIAITEATKFKPPHK